MKSNKGITLTTLVITMIIILIMVGTISMQALNQINMQDVQNMYTDLRVLTDKINAYFLEYGTIPTLAQDTKILSVPLEMRNPNDGELYYKIDFSKLKNLSLNAPPEDMYFYVINGDTNTIYYTKGVTVNGKTYYRLPEEYTVGKLDKSLKLGGIEVGDTVKWTPNGKYTQWKANYYSDDDTIDKILYSGNTAQNESVTTTTSWNTATNGNHNIDMTISSWKVLDVSDDRKTVRLVPSAPTRAGVNLRGAQGYNNAVKLLNDA